MSTLVILVGNIGTGKTTFCKKLKKHDRFIVCPDNYSGTKKEKRDKMIKELENGLENYKYVIVDGPSLSIKQRDKLLYFSKKKNHNAIVFDFGIGNEFTLQRRINANPEISPEEWGKNHNRNKREYERPENHEGFDRVIRMTNCQN